MKMKPDYLKGWTYEPQFSSADMSTINDIDLANEITYALNRMYKEREMEMTYKGEKVVDVSPGGTAYLRIHDNIVELRDITDIKITDCCGEGALDIACRKINIQKVYDNAVSVYKPNYEQLPMRINKIKPVPRKVIFSGPATTILWKDGTKTTVKCSNEDVWTDEVGIAMCYLKKMLGNKGNYNNIFREAMKVAKVPTKKKALGGKK